MLQKKKKEKNVDKAYMKDWSSFKGTTRHESADGHLHTYILFKT